MTVEQVTPEVALEFWPILEPHVGRALAYDPYASITLEDVRQQIAEGYAVVLIGFDEEGHDLLMVTVAQIYQRLDGERVLHVLATAGQDSKRWLDELLHRLDELRRAQGLYSVTMSGRPGWAKKLSKRGWNVVNVDMEWISDEEWSEEDEQWKEPEPERESGQHVPGAVSGSIPAGSAGASVEAIDGRRSASGRSS